MKEDEWLKSDALNVMLDFIRGRSDEAAIVFGRKVPKATHFLYGRIRARKLRLFATACCRRVWTLMNNELWEKVAEHCPRTYVGYYLDLPLDSLHKAVELSERAADESVCPKELQQAVTTALVFSNSADTYYRYLYPSGREPFVKELLASGFAACAVVHACHDDPAWGCSLASGATALALAAQLGSTEFEKCMQGGKNDDRTAHCNLLRDIFGNPFRPSLPLHPPVLTWNNGTVRRIAESIYERRQMPEGTLDTGRLAILSNALLAAGCDDDAFLTHLRSEGPHVRGCWAVDLILGKG